MQGPAALEGLPQDYIDHHKPAADGTIQITTEYPDILPAMKFVKSDPLRRQLYEAFQTRAFPKNRAVLKQMMQTRYDIATILGYEVWADYYAADKMAGTGTTHRRVHTGGGHRGALPGRPRVRHAAGGEEEDRPDATGVGDYEVGHLKEMLRRSKYDFDSQSVRPISRTRRSSRASWTRRPRCSV